MNYVFPTLFPPQHQNKQPGIESIMNPEPIFELEGYHKPAKRLENKIAIITGGDSGIGRAVSLLYAKEGATVCIIYLNEDSDANYTKELIEATNGICELYKGDISAIEFCKKTVNSIISKYKTINILVSNAAEQHEVNSIIELTPEQLNKTFGTNFFGAIYITQSVMPYLKSGDSIIYTTSVTAYQGHETLLDYSCTKGALATLTRSLAKELAPNGIRVNAVAPGPIWTPLIPSTFDDEKLSKFGSKTLFKRPGQPVEVAESYVFLASDSASFITGETIHVNGGEMLNN